MPANLENSAVATGLEKVSCHSNPKGNAKECSNYHTIALISHASKVMLKIFQARLQEYVNHELFRCSSWIQKRQRSQRSNCQHLLDHREPRELHRNIYFCFNDCAKVFDCMYHSKPENSQGDENTKTPYLHPEKPVCK